MNGRGMTLVELVVSMTILGVVAALTLPAISTATGAMQTSSGAREITDDVSFALDRVAALLREAPTGNSANELAIAEATGSSVVFADGRGVRLRDGDLVWIEPGGEAVLCAEVDSFEIVYLSADGLSVAADGTRTHRFLLRLSRGGIDLRTAVFPRVRVGGN